MTKYEQLWTKEWKVVNEMDEARLEVGRCGVAVVEGVSRDLR
jgi:hypothetical protein